MKPLIVWDESIKAVRTAWHVPSIKEIKCITWHLGLNVHMPVSNPEYWPWWKCEAIGTAFLSRAVLFIPMTPITLQGNSQPPTLAVCQVYLNLASCHLTNLISSHSILPTPILGDENRVHCVVSAQLFPQWINMWRKANSQQRWHRKTFDMYQIGFIWLHLAGEGQRVAK